MLRASAVVAASTLIIILGVPQIADSVDVTVTPIVDLAGVEASVNSTVASLDPEVASIGTELNTEENTLLTDANLSPALVGAVVALGLIEAGGTLPSTCASVATLEKSIPTSVLGIPISVAEILGLTGVQTQLITNYLDNLLQAQEQTILADLSPTALNLLQLNYNTTFFPSAGNPITSPVVRTTRGLIGLPALIDADGQPGLDLCADTSIDIGSLTSLVSASELSSLGLTSLSSLSSLNTTTLLGTLGSLALSSINLSSLKIDQNVTKLPLAATTLPVNLSAVLPNLGGIGFGYNTQNSSVPQAYSTTIQIGSNPLLGMSDTTTAPGPSLTQTISLGSTLSINNTWAPVPSAMTTGLTMSGEALSFPNTVSSPSDWSFNLPLSSSLGITASVNQLTSAAPTTTTMTIGTGLSASYSGGTATSTNFNAAINLGTSGSIGLAVAPLPTSFSSCYALASISCSNVNTVRGTTFADSTGDSMNFVASSPATVTQALYLASPAPVVTAVSPATGSTIGGNTVTLTGTGFATNPGGTLIYFGANPAGNVTCSKATTCTATVPAGTAGNANITASVSGQSTPATAAALPYAYVAGLGTATPPFPNPGFSCGDALTTLYSHVTGTDIYEDFIDNLSGTTGAGHAWLDTGGTPVSGCTGGLGLVENYAAGTKAGGSTPQGRLGVFTGSSGNGTNDLTKDGAITCPTGTTVNYEEIVTELGSLLAGLLLDIPASGDVSNWLCPTPPVVSKVPVITPSSPVYIGSVLNTTSGTFTPTDMASTTTLQWYRCTSATSCAQIPGATGSSYAPVINNSVPASSDVGKTIEVIATNQNSDGSITATSAQTAVVAIPPPPVPGSPAPLVTTTGPETLSTTNGTFTTPVPVTYSYQWQLCTPPSFVCNNIAGQTASTLTLPAGADQGDLIQVLVTATNTAGGTGSINSNQFTVPAIPSNSVLPSITDTTQSISDTTGMDVSQGDTLTANNGTWSPTSGVTYSYTWSHCTTAATPVCTSVGTGATYQLLKTDVGFTMELTVKATDFSGSGNATSNKSNPTSPNSLAFQPPQSVVDGTVNATAADSSGDTYIGGAFDTIGPGVGGAGSIPVTSATGKNVTTDAGATGGSVLAIAPDGSGGYFIGGSFTKVQNVACPSLAHITSAGVLDTTYCFPTGSGPVNALDLARGLLAVGGSFTVSGDQNLVFVDSAGAYHASGGDPNGPVNAIVDDGSVFIVGGQFTSLGTSTPTVVNNLAKYGVTGTTVAPITTFVPSILSCTVPAFTKALGCVTPASGPAVVDSLATVRLVTAITLLTPGVTLSDELIVGGSFTSESTGNGTPNSAVGTARTNAAAISDGTSCTISTGVLSPAETTAQLTPASIPCPSTGAGTLAAWAPNPNGTVRAIAATGAMGFLNLGTPEQSAPVYLGGDFTSLGGQAVTGLGEYAIGGFGGAGAVTLTAPASSEGVNWVAVPNAQSPSTTWTPQLANGPTAVSVHALAIDGNGNIEAGGTFTTVNGNAFYRIVQLSPNTGAGSTAVATAAWNPEAGNTVNALAISGSNVLVGGGFMVLGGSPYLNVAEMGANGSVVSSWNPGVNGTVSSMAVNGSNVYVGGTFTNAGGLARTDLAAITTGGASVSGFAPAANGPVLALDAANGTLYAGGSFTSIGGAAANGLSAVKLDTGATAGWTPILATGAVVQAIVANASDVYAGGAFTAGSQVNAAEFNSVSGVQTGWNPGEIASGTVSALALSGTAVYLGGSLGAESVDPSLGTTLNWADAAGPVKALALSSDGTTIFAGGSFTSIGGAARNGLAGLQTGSGAHTTFNPGPSGSTNAMVLTTSGGQDVLTIGGAMQTILGQISGGFGIF